MLLLTAFQPMHPVIQKTDKPLLIVNLTNVSSPGLRRSLNAWPTDRTGSSHPAPARRVHLDRHHGPRFST